MSTYNPHHQTARLYEAARQWCEQSLTSGTSVLDPSQVIWTAEHLDELDQKFVQNPDEGGANFVDKLEAQLAGANPAAIRLMAELLWVMNLFPSNAGPSKKREVVTTVWAWSGDALPAAHPLLADDVLGGIGSAGTAYNAQRWRELSFFITILRALRELDRPTQHSIVQTGTSFVEWLSEQPGASNRQLLNILPHLLFPDEFERISSRADKESILAALTPDARGAWRRRSILDLDRALLKLRQRLEAEAGQPIDFYSDELKPRWKPEATSPTLPGERPSFAEALSRFLQAYDEARTQPFGIGTELRQAMRSLEDWLANCPPIAKRPTLKVKISVGQGGWTKTPWVAVLDSRMTTSTQRGIYIVFLVSEDLSATYLTLNQGMTDLVSKLGQRGATEEMLRVADRSRTQLSDSLVGEFALDGNIDLQSDTSAARNYQTGTIAHVALPSDQLPDDARVTAWLSELVRAYDRLIEGHAEPVADQDGIALAAQQTPAFSVDDALQDLFLDRDELEELLLLWRAKKNLVLQGPPGVGKSFASKKLAYALMQTADPGRLGFVQFHQSYSYEDFVQGYRPSEEGFTLRQGKFVTFCTRASAEPDKPFVFIIDEINRGNLSRILGELMLLIESDKRSTSWAMPLAYSESEFHVPENVYILGLMNTADRSLAVVDYALRRRFSFVDLLPRIHTSKFEAELVGRGVTPEIIQLIRTRLGALNDAITADTANLGPGFAIGHSFFCAGPVEGEDSLKWYRRIVRTEILPLLSEYWFDAPDNVATWTRQLLGDTSG